MKIDEFLDQIGSEFYTGVPDSQLRALCDYLMATYGEDPKRHIIAANEGNAAAIAAGYHLATGKVPVVYMQNSGEGNIINPVASLLNEEVYGIPCIFIVGWRGEPGVHDEPQHIFQGKVTLKLLEDLDIAYFVVGKETTEDQVSAKMADYRALLSAGKQVAFVIRKGALEFDGKITYKNSHPMTREEAIRRIVEFTGDDPIVSTTGKASRELFEIREARGEGHGRDFLTVGSMGHASSIALGIAVQRPEKRVWVLDGDGAALMHLGAMAMIGAHGPENLVHIVLNNAAHESVGGMPTAAGKIDLPKIAQACGYGRVYGAATGEELQGALAAASAQRTLTFLEVQCAIGARPDLGRPTTTPQENKRAFMKKISQGAKAVAKVVDQKA